MERRSMLASLAALLASSGVARAQVPREDREEGCGRFLVLAKGTFGSPRWDGNQRVRGVHLIFNSYQPRHHRDYYVTAHLQIDANFEELGEPRDNRVSDWQDVKAKRDNRAQHYRARSNGAAREWVKMQSLGVGQPDPIYLFLPDAVMDLRQNPYRFRYQLRYLTPSSEAIPHLTTSLPPFQGGVSIVSGAAIISYGFAVGALDVDICDVYEGRTLDLNSLVE